MDKNINWQIIHFNKVNSTNDVAREYSKVKAQQYIVILADEQTAGRGRRGRIWQSPKGNLFFSVLLEFPLQNLGALVIISSLSLYQALKALAPNHDFKIKWPNDILLNNAKISGMLLEKAEGEYFIIGIGVNIQHCPSSESLLYSATSLYANGILASPNIVLQNFLHNISSNLRYFEEFGIANLRNQWLSNVKGLGSLVSIQQDNKTICGRFTGIDDNAGLLLETPDGNKRILIGDVFYIKDR